MTEPSPDRGETWEQFFSRRLMDKAIIELSLATCEPWERADLEAQMTHVRFDISCAERRVEEPVYPEIDW
jgi:hypothetical protein